MPWPMATLWVPWVTQASTNGSPAANTGTSPMKSSMYGASESPGSGMSTGVACRAIGTGKG